MNLIFLAHASFLIITNSGTRIITDPYKTGCFNNSFRYQAIKESADVVLVSHEHDDHNDVSAVLGKPQVIRGEGTWTVKDIKITGINSYHDMQKGAARGKNTIFIIEADSIRIVHLGDLGHSLSKEDCSKIGPVDILLSPVGGFFTIDGKIATDLFNCLKPNIMIPMHYKTASIDFPIVKVEEFLKDKKNVKKINNSEIEISKETLLKTSEIWVLKMAKE